jgi:hypothetical protein
MIVAIDVEIVTISNKDYTDLINNFTCPYLQLAIDYKIAMNMKLNCFYQRMRRGI